MYKEIPIYFSDLKEEAQKKLLEAVGAADPKEMNWDIDLVPLGYYPCETNEAD